jgi:5'-phosphate synthase pdxT subunit
MVGVLALHGDVVEHMTILKGMGAQACEVRTVDDVRRVDRLIIPGGESTVMSKLLWEDGLAKEIQTRARSGALAIYGTCAGAILLAENVVGDHPVRTLGLMDIEVRRNAYGTQSDSFEATLKVKGMTKSLSVAFIRAPVITRVGKNADVLARHEGRDVLVRQGRMLAGTFHPEVRGQTEIHKMFLKW